MTTVPRVKKYTEITQAAGPYCTFLKSSTKPNCPLVEKKQTERKNHSRLKLGLANIMHEVRKKKLQSSHHPTTALETLLFGSHFRFT